MSVIQSKFCHGYGDQPPHLVPKSEFTQDSRRDDGLCVYCKACAAARQRAWKRSNPEKVKAAKRDYRDTQRRKNHGG